MSGPDPDMGLAVLVIRDPDGGDNDYDLASEGWRVWQERAEELAELLNRIINH